MSAEVNSVVAKDPLGALPAREHSLLRALGVIAIASSWQVGYGTAVVPDEVILHLKARLSWSAEAPLHSWAQAAFGDKVKITFQCPPEPGEQGKEASA